LWIYGLWWRIGDVGGKKLNKTTCKVCGYVFELTKKRHYIAREKTELFLLPSNKMEPTLYDAFDCPNCGCQYIANERKRVFSKGDKNDTGRSD